MTQQQTVFLVIAAIVVAFLIVNGQKSSGAQRAPVPVNIMDPSAWEIGPADYPGGNPSKNVPLHPMPHAEGWYIDIPQPNADAGHVHYVTVPTNALAGKSKVTLRCRVEAAPGVKLVPRNFPDAPSLLTLYLQRKGDDYSAEKEAYRWWASFSTVQKLAAGEYVLEARFDQNWTAMLRSESLKNHAAFQAALNDPARIGFTLGGGDGLGHGVYATGQCRIVVTAFHIE